MIKFFDRSDMFRALTRERYAKRLIETRGEDFSVVEDQINHILRVERWKQWFRNYFPRLSLNVVVKKIIIIKADPKPSQTTKELAEKSLKATLPRAKIEIVEADRPE